MTDRDWKKIKELTQVFGLREAIDMVLARHTEAPAPQPRVYQHHVLCSADRRFPAGDPGHGCVCFEIKPPGLPLQITLDEARRILHNYEEFMPHNHHISPSQVLLAEANIVLRMRTSAPTERTFTAEQVQKAIHDEVEHYHESASIHLYDLEAKILMRLDPPKPKPKTPEERVTVVPSKNVPGEWVALVDGWNITNILSFKDRKDAERIAVGLRTELAKERP